MSQAFTLFLTDLARQNAELQQQLAVVRERAAATAAQNARERAIEREQRAELEERLSEMEVSMKARCIAGEVERGEGLGCAGWRLACLLVGKEKINPLFEEEKPNIKIEPS